MQVPAGGGMLSSHATYKTLFLTKMFVGNARTGDNEGVTHNYNLQTVYKVVAVTGQARPAYHYISARLFG